MQIQTAQQLSSKRCVPCEGGIAACSLATAQQQLENLSDWQLTHNNQRLRKDWTMKNFATAMKWLNQVGEVAEEQSHHPDLHLEGYRHVWIEIWTHAIDGLSENDFILAAKIDEIETN